MLRFIINTVSLPGDGQVSVAGAAEISAAGTFFVSPSPCRAMARSENCCRRRRNFGRWPKKLEKIDKSAQIFNELFCLTVSLPGDGQVSVAGAAEISAAGKKKIEK